MPRGGNVHQITPLRRRSGYTAQVGFMLTERGGESLPGLSTGRK